MWVSQISVSGHFELGLEMTRHVCLLVSGFTPVKMSLGALKSARPQKVRVALEISDTTVSSFEAPDQFISGSPDLGFSMKPQIDNRHPNIPALKCGKLVFRLLGTGSTISAVRPAMFACHEC